MINFSVTKNGRPLNRRLYIWNERTRTFKTNENDLIIDFIGIHKVTFTTGANCIFTTGANCIFTTGAYCTFDTLFGCKFDTGYDCMFYTGSDCMFYTGSDCVFKTGSDCVFKTGHNCVFKVRYGCVVIRRDIFEIIKLKKYFNHIKLNGIGFPGYTEVLPEVKKELNDFYFTEEDFKIK